MGGRAVDRNTSLRYAKLYGFSQGRSRAPAGIKEQPLGYIRPREDFLHCRPIADFPIDPQLRGDQIISWIARDGGILEALLAEHRIVS